MALISVKIYTIRSESVSKVLPLGSIVVESLTACTQALRIRCRCFVRSERFLTEQKRRRLGSQRNSWLLKIPEHSNQIFSFKIGKSSY